MAEQKYISVYTDQMTVEELDAWAEAESRSRNNLIQVIIMEAIKRRKAARQVAEGLALGPLPVPMDVCADADAA